MSIDPTTNLSQQAVAALDAGQPQQAIALLQPACDESGSNPRHWFLLGTAYGMTGNAAAAEQALRESLRLNPHHIQAMANLGRALAEQNKFDEAADAMQQVLATSPGHRPVRVGLINTLTHLHRFAEAEIHCEQLIAANRNDPEVLTLQGKLHKMKGELDRALSRFEQALDTDPGYVPAHMNKGLALRSMGNDKAAIESFAQASRLAPNNSAVWFTKGMTHIAANDLEQAAEDLEEAFRLEPHDVTAGGQLAKVYRHLRRLPESVEISRRVLAVDPDNARAKFYVESFRKQGDDQAVQRIPREVCEANYSQPDVGRNFEASLKGGLEYRAPDVLNDAVRAACGNRKSGLDILEIGCGTGLCGSRFADIARTLVGTDLSPSMLEMAREKNAYTDLYVADLVDVLSDNPNGFDLVIAMDVLCYFGDLTDIFRNCHDTLRANGVFAFSVEKPDDDELWLLHPYGHFVHSLRHLQQAAGTTGFKEIFVKEMVLRRELSEQRIGYVCLYRRD